MGMFDSVYADCAGCGAPLEFQSKEGDCCCYNFTLETAPTGVLTDVLNEPQYCRQCGAWCALVDPAFEPAPPPRPSPRMVRLRQPLDSEVSIHSSQPFLRWWEAPFSFADIAPASAIEAATAGETGNTGSTEGESAVPEGQTPKDLSND